MDSVFEQRVYALTLRVIELVDSLERENVSRRMGDQLLRSGTSIIANLTEGQAGSTRRDYTNFMNHALKSVRESYLGLRLLRDSGRVSPERGDPLMREMHEIIRILAASVITLRRTLGKTSPDHVTNQT